MTATTDNAAARPRLVIIESPYAGATPEDVAANERYARAALSDCLRRGEAPFASHLLYTQPGVLRDDVPAERDAGITAGLAWGERAAATVIYIDRGISSGMWKGFRAAVLCGRPVEWRAFGGWPLVDGAPPPRPAEPVPPPTEAAEFVERLAAPAAEPFASDIGQAVLAALRVCADPANDDAAEAFGRALGEDVVAARRRAAAMQRPLFDALSLVHEFVTAVADESDTNGPVSAGTVARWAWLAISGASAEDAPPAAVSVVEDWTDEHFEDETVDVGPADFLAAFKAGAVAGQERRP